MKKNNTNRYTQWFLMLVAMLLADPTWAASNFVMTLKGGSYYWSDQEQETAETDVKYSNDSGTYAIGFEQRLSAVAFGGEIMRVSSSWNAVDPAAFRPRGKIDVDSVSFVSRKYFTPAGNFVPFVGGGIGYTYAKSTYTQGLGHKSESKSGLILQVNVGGELRWEHAGLMFELKHIKADTADSSSLVSLNDFPDMSGTIGYIGYSILL